MVKASETVRISHQIVASWPANLSVLRRAAHITAIAVPPSVRFMASRCEAGRSPAAGSSSATPAREAAWDRALGRDQAVHRVPPCTSGGLIGCAALQEHRQRFALTFGSMETRHLRIQRIQLRHAGRQWHRHPCRPASRGRNLPPTVWHIEQRLPKTSRPSSAADILFIARAATSEARYTLRLPRGPVHYPQTAAWFPASAEDAEGHRWRIRCPIRSPAASSRDSR